MRLPLLVLALLTAAPATRAHSQSGPFHLALQSEVQERSHELSASVLQRVIRVDIDGVSLSEAIDEVGRRASLPLVYSRALIPAGRTVSLRAERITAGEALERLLDRTELEVRELETGYVVIALRRAPEVTQPAEPDMPLAFTARGLPVVTPVSAPPPLQGTVQGRVTSAVTGEPLNGAQVVVLGAGSGALTAQDGTYTISAVPAGLQRLRATLIGYGAAEASVTVSTGMVATANFALQQEALALEGVVAVGYGTQRRRDITGAVGSVDVEAARSAPAVSVDQVLQGRVSGVHVTQASGAPGGAVSVRIRGTNSVSASSEPLYVIDGVPAFVGSRDTPDTRGLPLNPLADISPNDIESIEVLKDASATAIYGSRGANGVVLITTRRGRRGENIVQVESSYGTQRVARTLDMLNAREYAEMLNEGQTNMGRPAIFTPEQVASFGEGTDWQSEIYRDAPVQNHALTLSGGDERTRYLVSGSLFDQSGIVINSGFRRYSGRLNLDREVNDRFRIGNSLTISRSQSDQIISDSGSGSVSGVVAAALESDPTTPVRDEDGNLIMLSPFGFPNPVATSEITNERTASRLLGTVFGEYDLAEGLQFRTSIGGNAYFERENYYAPSYVAQGQATSGVADVRSVQASELVNDNLLTYRRTLREGNDVDFTGGFTMQRYRSEWLGGSARRFATDVTGPANLGAGAEPGNPGSGVTEWTLLSWLGRANYSLLDRYLLTVTGRYDGSSKFGANHKWGFFPSAALAWRVSDEPFLQDASWLTDLKLRTSYGLTGNQEIGTYASLAQLSTTPYLVGGRRVTGYMPAGRAPNPDLRWESTRQFDVGVDVGVMDNRVVLTADYYRSVTEDLLLTVGMPRTTGFGSQLRNVGSVRNHGVELSLNTVNVETPVFSWNTSLTLARNRNEVVSLGDRDRIVMGDGPNRGLIDTDDFTVLEPGQPLGNFYVYPVQGIWQVGDSCPFQNTNDCTPGEYRYLDTNGDGLSTPDDRVIAGNSEPDFYGGLTNRLTLGPVDLDVFFTGSFGNEVLNMMAVRAAGAGSGSNMFAWTYDRWTPDNQSTTVPRANNSRVRRLLSEHVEDGTFVRLQNVTLGYRVPEGLLPGAHSARLYVSGQNLWVSSNYRGYDPELSSYGGHPVYRAIDVGAYPRARTLNIGAHVTF